MNSNRILIFDTTLRDGEQSPGAAMTAAEKLEVARALAAMGVDIIEAGFPAASPDDLDAVRRIAGEVGSSRAFPSGRPPVICGLARMLATDIDKAWEAVQHAERPRVHTFIATSEIHLRHKLNMTRFEVLERIRTMVAYTRTLCADVEFSPEDAGRTDPAFLYEALSAAIEAGATTLNIPDTVGYTTPEEFGGLIAGILKNVPGIAQHTVSVHCHDDLGLATANTLAGLRAGARQAEVTVNGIGERAGNTSLEEVVMALRTRGPLFNFTTGIETMSLMRVSKLVSYYTGIAVQPNKAIVGANAFAHEAGIHQDGMLKHQQTYEIMEPESVGVARTRLVLGKHSGRHAFKVRLAELGYVFNDAELEKAFARFKTLADKKKIITDADLTALSSDQLFQPIEFYRLDALQVACGTVGLPTATVRLRGPEGEIFVQASVGSGPVDACYKAIDAVVKAPNTLREFSVHAVTAGIDALGEVTVRIEAENSSRALDPQKETGLPKTFGGHGADTDIVVAGAKAYLAALNKLLVASGKYAGNKHNGASTTADSGWIPEAAAQLESTEK
jgi:2-isopropylmalate synthase